MRETFDQLMDLYEELKREIKIKSPYQFERWKAGGYIVDPDVMSMYSCLEVYPCLEDVISAIEVDEIDEAEAEDE